MLYIACSFVVLRKYVSKKFISRDVLIIVIVKWKHTPDTTVTQYSFLNLTLVFSNKRDDKLLP